MHNLVFMMIDIDHFKLYNDTYGHQMGDEVLIRVSSALQSCANRGNDFAFRYGGEEFSIITSSINEKEVLVYANRLKETIEGLNILHKKSTTSSHVTISIGIFIFKPHMDYDENKIIKFADDALYKAKEQGRNQVIINNRD